MKTGGSLALAPDHPPPHGTAGSSLGMGASPILMR